MKRLCLSFMASMVSIVASAISAYPWKIPVQVNGQEIFIYLFGDEHRKRAETADGYTIIQNDQQQWCYARLNEQLQLEASQWQVGITHNDDAEFDSFINKTPLHLTSKNWQDQPTKSSEQRQSAAVGERRMLIILMQYKDLEMSKSKDDFDRLFNQEGYQEDGAQGSVRDFYLSASYGQLLLKGDVYGPYTASQEMSYYGKNSVTNNYSDVNAYELFVEAITAVEQDVDLSQYDGDGDGFIDNVHIIYAGYGEEAGGPANAIWAHEATFYRPYVIQDLKIDHYSCAPELRGNKGSGISRIGPHCHEIGHALGAMDYYDTDYTTNGEFPGTGMWDVMASGSWNNDGITPADFNPYVKAYNYGWITPKVLPVGNISIAPSYQDAENYYMLRSSEFGDYYLIENRSKDSWGDGLPGEGLLIFHIHSDLPYSANEINAAAPQKCYIVCASSTNRQPNGLPSSYGNVNSDGCPFPGSSGNKNFGKNTTPMPFYWSGEECKIDLSNITLQADGHITLTNESEDAGYVPPIMASIFKETFEGNLAINIMESNSRQWQVVENPNNKTQILMQPIANTGVRSLQLSAQDQYYDESNAFEFTCTPNNSNGKIRLKGYYTSYGLKSKKANTLKIGYKTADGDDWIFTNVESTQNQQWKQFFVDIPFHSPLQFRVEGVAKIGSILAIDDLEVEQEVVADNVSFPIREQDCSGVSIYDMAGRKQIRLAKGMSIIKGQRGKVIKVISL